MDFWGRRKPRRTEFKESVRTEMGNVKKNVNEGGSVPWKDIPGGDGGVLQYDSEMLQCCCSLCALESAKR